MPPSRPATGYGSASGYAIWEPLVLIAVGAALAAALLFAVSSVLQQSAAASAPPEEVSGGRLLFVLVRRPIWLAGVGAAIGSVLMQAVALAHGPLTLVQPLIVLELVFAMPLNARTYRARLGLREWAGILTVVAGLAIFLITARPREGNPEPPMIQWLVIAAVLAVPAGCWIAASRSPSGPRRATLLGCAAGTLFGVQSALLKTLSHVSRNGLLHILTSWHIYAFAAVAIAGTICSQSAFQAGPLPFSLPAIDTCEPTISALIGVVIFGEAITTSPAALAVELLGGAALAAGIATLDRSPLLLAMAHHEAPPSISRAVVE